MFLTVTEPGSRGGRVPLPLTAMSPGPGPWQAPSKHLFYVLRGFPLASRVTSVPVLEKEGPCRQHIFAKKETRVTNKKCFVSFCWRLVCCQSWSPDSCLAPDVRG